MDEAIGIGIEFSAMASHCEVRAAGLSADAAHAACLAAIDEVRRIETRFSRYRDDSVVGRINRAAGGEPVAVDEETMGLLAYADALYHESGGLFDATSGVLRLVWNFGAGRPPKPEWVDAILPRIGWHRVEWGDGRVRLPEAGMQLDFGGFGKEYAADRAAAVLIEHGMAHGFVNLGGDLRAIGPRPDGAPWRIGIQDPRHAESMIAWIPLSRGGLATSGDYERYVEIDGRRYCHILDPRTGMPVRAWQSISVVAPDRFRSGAKPSVRDMDCSCASGLASGELVCRCVSTY